jgi:phosphomannomutase
MPQVYIGFDTRESSPKFAEAVMLGVKALGVDVKNFGEVTTP